MLFLLIPAAWLAAVLIGLALCRLSAVSDERQATALSEWITAARLADIADGESSRGSRQPHDPREGYRAAG